MATSTERNRRARAHKRGDHSQCLNPDACDAPATPETRGERLIEALTAAGPLPPMQMVLAEEAGRLADRLDVLDELIRAGDTSLLSEARQQAATLKQIVAELRQAGAAKQKGAPSTAEGVPAGVADLTAAIRARRASSAG